MKNTLHQKARRLHLQFTNLGKGATIPCAPRLDPNRLWGSACAFLYEDISNPTFFGAPEPSWFNCDPGQ